MLITFISNIRMLNDGGVLDQAIQKLQVKREARKDDPNNKSNPVVADFFICVMFFIVGLVVAFVTFAVCSAMAGFLVLFGIGSAEVIGTLAISCFLGITVFGTALYSNTYFSLKKKQE